MTVILVVATILALVLGALALRTEQLRRRAERAVPRVGRMQNVRGGAIHWVESGPPDARPVVMIHGLAGQLQHFTFALVPLLAEEFRVIALDRPGSGWSERHEDRLAAPAEQARMIAQFLAARKIERPLIVGHSLGGAVALSLALDHPDRVGALALLAPLSHPLTQMPDAFRGLDIGTPWLRRALGRTLAVPFALRTAPITLRAVFAPEPWPERYLTDGGGALGLRPKAFVSACADLSEGAGALADMAARYPALSTPGGVLFGAEDAILDPQAQGRALADAAPAIDLEIAEGRGHMLPITAPEACADFIRAQAAKLPA